MLGPILGPALGGVITDLASWRWVFVLNIPLGIIATWRMRELLPLGAAKADAGFDVIGLFLLIAGIGALQLSLQRGASQAWLSSPELLGGIAIAVIAFALIAARVRRSGFGILRLDVFKDLNFATAAFFNFVTSGLLFTAIVFLPTLVQRPLGYPATIAGLTIVPRGIFMMLAILAVGQVITRIDYRIVLAIGSGFMVAGLGLLTAIHAADDLLWIVAGSTVQAIGAGLVLMPLSTYAFASLPVDMRTDATGLYNLLRHIGCASWLALMSAVLQTKIAAHAAKIPAELRIAGEGHAQFIDGAMLKSYDDCFMMMAISAAVITPLILLFRSGRGAQATPSVVPGD